MATAQKLTEQFLTCAVCFEVFKDPATLDCQHTFCRLCLVLFTKSKPAAIKGKYIPCPFCDRSTKIIQYKLPVEKWVEELKVSFLIRSMMDSFGPEAQESNFCGLCLQKGENVTATAWCIVCSESYCKNCLDIHCRMPISRDHPVENLTGNKRATVKRQQIVCSEHNELVKIYCRNCDKAICNTCCSLSHRVCLDIVPIVSVITEMKTTLKENKGKLEVKIGEEKAELEMIESSVRGLETSAENAKAEISKVFKKVIEKIERKQIQMVEKVDNLVSEAKEQYKEERKSIKMSIQMCQQTSEFINQAIAAGSESHIHDLYCSNRGGAFPLNIQHTEKQRALLTSIGVGVHDAQVTGNLQQMIEIFTVTRGPLDGVSLPRSHIDIPISLLQDEQTPSPSDVHVMKVEGVTTILVTDSGNMSLKAICPDDVDVENSCIQLDGAPWSITPIQQEVVVTIPDKRQLVRCSVRPELKVVSTVNTSKAYRGIATYSLDTLLVASDTSSSVVIDIVNLQGRVLKTFSTPDIRGPLYLSAIPDGKIFFTDTVSKSIVCLTPGGETEYVYPFSKGTIQVQRGIQVNKSGDVLYVDRNSNKVTHLSADGKFVRNVLTAADGITKPWGLYFMDNRLYVTERGKGIKCFVF